MSNQVVPDAASPSTSEFLGRVRQACVLESLRGGPIVVGVSGGADSVGLLHAVVHGDVLPPGRPQAARPIIVAHAEHDLRDEAADDRAFVVELASRMGVEVVTRRLACREAAGGSGEGIEATARRLRYSFLTEVAATAGARAVLVAHTAEDQAETILHALLRGTGLGGLAGMAASRELSEGIVLVRPLLGIDRASLRRYLGDVGQAWRDDATNTDTRFSRNFLRHEILARVEAGPYPAAAAAIRRLGRQAAEVAQAVASAAGMLLDDHGSRTPEGAFELDSKALASLDPHLLAEVFVAIWKRGEWPRRDMTARHYRQLAKLLIDSADGTADPSSLAADLPGGVRVMVAASGRLRLQRRS